MTAANSVSWEPRPSITNVGFDVEAARRDFPILQMQVYGHPLVYLDNAATTQKPASVIARLKHFYEHENSNVHRGAHELAARATDAYEAAREKVRGFLNARSANEIVFVRGATEAINLVAQSWGRRNVGPGDEIHMPKVSTFLDYEAELALVIGKRCRHVPAERAHEVIAGYTCANDVTVRDWQGRAQTMQIGKSFDTHGPLGPWLVTPDELGDPQDLRIRCLLDGEVRQDASTAEMVFDCFQQVSHLSEAFTLEPGDVIATGTPAGVGIGRQPIRDNLLKVGSTVTVEIEGIGELVNTVVPEPDDFLAGA